MEEKIPLALYLWRRIAELGVESIFGVPGDMNLELLDYVKVQGLNWVGNASELGAAYAADGYCRVKQVPGVIVTTMGVGELSAINGVAGAYTEQVKLVHIVGTTGTAAQKKNAMIHHCLGPNPDHRVYEKMSSPVRAAHCWLDDASTAPAEVDRVLRACLSASLPVYIFVPMDLVRAPVPPPSPSFPLSAPTIPTPSPPSSSLIPTILTAIYTSRAPIILVDALVARHAAAPRARRLLSQLQLPTFATPMGKGIADERAPYFCGTYNGRVSHPGVARAVEEDSDFVLELGPLLSDSNTGGHSRCIDAAKLVSVHPHETVVRGGEGAAVGMRDVLDALLAQLEVERVPVGRAPDIAAAGEVVGEAKAEDGEGGEGDDDAIRQAWVWRRIGEDFVRGGDVLVVEAGTAQFGMSDAAFPTGLTYVTQIYYGSIGYALPACLGAAVAKREMGGGGRVVLVTGDGSAQMTAQEVGTMLRVGLRNVLILVINNGGYTIERAIHGPEEAYNDIAAWNWQLMLSFYGDKNGSDKSREVKTKQELQTALALPEYTDLRSIQLLEIHMEKMDIPWRLKAQIDLITARMKIAAKTS